jgi:hypothetical protein
LTGGEKLDRCYVVHALAPSGLRPREANDAFNEFIADPRRGLVVWHDHFIGEQGGVAVFHIAAADELARLRESGPLEGWAVDVRPLTFSLAPSGFRAQIDFTLRTYRGTTLEEVEAHETPERRHWWRRERTLDSSGRGSAA